MPTFKQLITTAYEGDSKQEDRVIEFIVRVRVFGRLDQAWKTVRAMRRNLQTTSGDCFSFHMLDGTEITEESRPGATRPNAIT